MSSGGEIITIINNSGKIIGTGKQLVGIFKEARAAYRERKDAVKADKAERVAGIKRAQTFDVSQRSHHLGVLEEDEEDEIDRPYEQRAIRDVPHRRHSQDDGRSVMSNRSHRPRRLQPARSPDRQTTLTESNLRAHTEVSATPPSAAPAGYRSPYAETAPRDMQLSRPALVHAATMPLPTPTEVTTPVSTPRQSMVVHRPRSDMQLKKKEIDMDLAYGNVPPDLASRVDLDHGQTHDRAVTLSRDGPAPAAPSPAVDGADDPESQAINMIDRIEGILDEAHCLHHTASSMIAHLQENPQAAAAVALTLAELSALIGKMSPAFLGVIKGGSPAIFALLASPQFLIGTGIAVGVTVLVFGGLKIVKRIAAANKEKEAPIEMQAVGGAAAAAAPRSEVSYEEALVLEVEEELSTIESWRRGVEPSLIDDDEEETADVELMSPEADRALRERFEDEVDPWDSVSQAGRSTARSYRSHRSHRSRRPRGEGEDVDVPERKSSKRYHGEGGASEVAESVRSHRSHRSHSSRTSRRDGEDGEDAGKPKEKKNNMLRLLFRKMKEKEEKDKDSKDKEKSKEKTKEKDRESKVGRDKESRVGKDKESTVGRDRESRVGKDRDRESRVGKDRESRVGRDKESTVGRDRESRVGKDRESRVGGSRAMSIMV